jgi:hypothetical protein
MGATSVGELGRTGTAANPAAVPITLDVVR